MAESKFKNLQEDVCELTKKEQEEEIDKICPTCIPNPNFFIPDWRRDPTPFLNEKTCEYMIPVSLNSFGNFYTEKLNTLTATERGIVPEQVSIEEEGVKFYENGEVLINIPFNTLLKSYVRPAIRKLLRFYNKLETDEIVCASAQPLDERLAAENEAISQAALTGGAIGALGGGVGALVGGAIGAAIGQVTTGLDRTIEPCSGIFGLDYEEFIEIREYNSFETVRVNRAISQTFPEIKNLNALELYGRVKDYDYIGNSKFLTVLVAIPAYIFDAVPNAPDLGSVRTTQDKVVLETQPFLKDLKLFKSAMKTFTGYQAYFHQTEQGFLAFQESGNKFYIKFYADSRIDKFRSKLENLLEANGFELKESIFGSRPKKTPFDIEITFDKLDEKKPFTVKTVRARFKDCPYVECSNGLDSFIEYTQADQTMLGYVASINQIGNELKANTTPPWLDFMVKYTFPQLTVNYGSSNQYEDNCPLLDLNKIDDFIFDQALDYMEAVAYQLNKNKCKTLEKKNEARKPFVDLIEDPIRQSVFQLDKNGNPKYEGGNGSRPIYTPEFDKLIQNFEKKRNENPSSDTTKDKLINISAGSTSISSLSEITSILGGCSIQKLTIDAMKCIMAGLSLDEAYYTLIKKMLSTIGEQSLEVFIGALPASKQQQIREEVKKQFGDMPFPWEPGWDGGDAGEALTRTATEASEGNSKQQKKASEESASIDQQIKILEARIQELRDPQLEEQYSERIIQQAEDLENQKILKRQEIDVISFEIDSLKLDLSVATTSLQAAESTIAFVQENFPSFLWASNEDYNRALQNKQTANQIINDSNVKIAFKETEIQTLEEEIQQFQLQQNTLTTTSLDQYKLIIDTEIQKILKEIEELEKKKSPSDQTAEDLEEYKDWDSKTEEEKQKIIEEQKAKTVLYKLKPGDEIQQGTLGKAAGNVQKVITQAYIDAIMNTATIRELQTAIESVPGIGLLSLFVSNVRCENTPLIYPPIDSFLNTLTLDPCRGGGPKFALPSFQGLKFPTNFNWLELVGEALYISLKELIKKLIMAMIMKLGQMLQGDICKSIATIGQAAIDDGFAGVVGELFCPDAANDNEAQKAILSNAGASPANGSDRAYRDLANALSVSATTGEIKDAMLGNPRSGFCANMSVLIKSSVPEFTDTFSDEQSVCNFFTQMGNLLTPSQLANLQAQAAAETDEFPVNNSICLTKEEKDLWDQQRRGAFNDPSLGQEFVNKQNEKALSDLGDAAEMLLNGTGLDDALSDALGSKDPDCKVNKSVIPDLPKNIEKQMSLATDGAFKKLQKSFIDDTISWNLFEAGDTTGLLSIILSDRKNRVFNLYNIINKNWFFKLILGEGVTPETVGVQMYKQILEVDDSYSFSVFSKSFPYANGLEGNEKYTSTIRLLDNTARLGFGYEVMGLEYRGSTTNQAPEEYTPILDEFSDEFPYKASSLKKMFEKRWNQFNDVSFSSDDIFDCFIGMNKIYFGEMTPKMVSDGSGNYSQGFRFGMNTEMPSEEAGDLTYVDPETGAEEYTYQEIDKVLGRSLTNNPRVHFLDPAVHGGSYVKPFIWIDPAEYTGWMNFTDIVSPNPDGCQEQEDFLMIDKLVTEVDSYKNKIKSHEGISSPPDCLKELPFDRVANSETLAMLQGIVQATIRTFLSDFLIRSFPIYSNISLRSENYGTALTSYIANMMVSEMENQTSFFPSNYDRYAYVLLFLEQVAQTVKRKTDNGEIKENDEVLSALQSCNTAQQQYIHVRDKEQLETLGLSAVAAGSSGRWDSIKNLMTEEEWERYLEDLETMKNRITQGVGFAASGPNWSDVFGDRPINWNSMSVTNARFASKLASIHSVVEDCKVLLNYLILHEMNKYTEKLTKNLNPRPYIYDVNRFFVGASGALLGDQIKSGLYDVEIPIGGGQSAIEYGNINDCAKFDMEHPLNNISIDSEKLESIKENGTFYLEKYAIVTEKEDGIELPENIKGTTSIQELREFLNSLESVLSNDKPLSEYFGDAQVEGGSYTGSIGIKFGVRLCYIPPDSFGGPFAGAILQGPSTETRTFILKEATINGETLSSSRFSFPVASFEQDVLDTNISEYFNADGNLNQDLKCYIDNLTETEDFKHLMNNIIDLRKLPTVLAIYSYENLLYSLGMDSSERDEPEDELPNAADNRGKIFNDTKKEAWKLFISYYRNDDRDPSWEMPKYENPFKDSWRKLREMEINIFDVGQFSLDVRRRIKKTNPFDEEGNPCQNDFMKLFI